jgi:hypothetical protein
MQEREELRALKREIKMSRERKVKEKKYVCIEKKEKKEERMKEKKKREERKRNGKKDMKWMNQAKDK